MELVSESSPLVSVFNFYISFPKVIIEPQNSDEKIDDIVYSSMQKTDPVRTYIRLFPSMGIDCISNTDYQILDGSTFLDKRDQKKLKMYSFNYIFTPEFDYLKIIQHMNLVNDTFEGIHQLLIVEVDREHLFHFLLGSTQLPGFILTIFEGLFNEAVYHGLGDEKQHSKTKKGIKRQQHISISVFSAEGSSNRFLDLVLGQRLTFYSKKDMDEHKNFYEKQIEGLREFLILLKLAITRYGQCCQVGDPIIFRINVHSYDELKDIEYQTCFHLIATETNSSVTKMINKKIELSKENIQHKGQDHGSIGNYIEKQLRKGKLSYIYTMPFRNKNIKESLENFTLLQKMRNYQNCVSPGIVSQNIFETMQKINECCYQKYHIGSHRVNNKQFNVIYKWMEKLLSFIIQTQSKWKIYISLVEDLLHFQDNFYQKQKFPISLEIKDDQFKSFHISRVYKLSETYQMEDLSPFMEKIRTIRNQVLIGIKGLSISKEANLIQSLASFATHYEGCVSILSQCLKRMFSITYRQIIYHHINLQESICASKVLNANFFKGQLKELAKQIKQSKEKQEIFFRKIVDVSSSTQNIQGNRSLLNSSSFQKYHSVKNSRINLGGEGKLNCSSFVNDKQNLESSFDKSTGRMPLISKFPSVFEERPHKYQHNFSLPRIAVIKRKKK